MTAPTPQQQTQAQPTASTAAMMAAYLAATAALRSRLLALTAVAFAGQGDYRDAAADAFVAAMVPLVQASQQTMASLTSAYLAHLTSAMAGGTAAPVGVPPEVLSNLRGVDPADVYRRPYVQVWTDLSKGKSLDTAVAAGNRRAQSIVATDLQLAKTRAAGWVMQSDKRVVGYRRVLVGAHSCGMCIVASSVRYHKSNLMPIHPGCVVGSTPVSNVVSTLGNPTLGVNVIKAATRRSYTGKLIIITTALGNQVTITPNHPVLTDKGWIPADRVTKGHRLVQSSINQRAISGSPQENQTPALIKDVWRSASVFGFVSVPLATQDFHGDGSDGEVNIVYTDGNFSSVLDRVVIQPSSELSFMSRHGSGISFPGLGSFAPFFPSSGPTGGGQVSRTSLRSSLFGGHLCSTHQASVRSAAMRDAGLFERSSDSATLHTVLRGESQLGKSLGVLVGDDVVRQLSPSSSPRRFDPAAAEFSGQGLGVYVNLGRSLLDRLAGQVSLDCVISVSSTDVTACHVYNLHTDEGWYSAGGLVVSNCDCAIAPILGYGDPGRTIDSAILSEGATEQAIGTEGMKFFEHGDVIEVGDLLEQAHRAVEDAFGRRATDAQQIDYRKVIMVREHGELGPVLTVADHKFTKKQLDTGNLRAKAGTFHVDKGRAVTNIGE